MRVRSIRPVLRSRLARKRKTRTWNQEKRSQVKAKTRGELGGAALKARVPSTPGA